MDLKFPQNLIKEYLTISGKLKKIERAIFKKSVPIELSKDFHSLAIKFQECNLFQYAAMCYLGSAKCSKNNTKAESDYYLKAAECFLKADASVEKLNLKTSRHELKEGALKCYKNVLSTLADESPMKASLIRKINQITPAYRETSNFNSPCHRIYDLEESTKECIESENLVLALDKLTDIYDNITERKMEKYYEDILQRTEITMLLLLISLELPKFRYSPWQIKLLEIYSDLDFMTDNNHSKNDYEIKSALNSLVISWLDNDSENITNALFEIQGLYSLSGRDRLLLKYLMKKYFI